MFTIILFFNGFESFVHSFSVSGFLASYITLPVVALSFFGFRLYQWHIGAPMGFTNLREVNLGEGPTKALRGTMYSVGV